MTKVLLANNVSNDTLLLECCKIAACMPMHTKQAYRPYSPSHHALSLVLRTTVPQLVFTTKKKSTNI